MDMFRNENNIYKTWTFHVNICTMYVYRMHSKTFHTPGFFYYFFLTINSSNWGNKVVWVLFVSFPHFSHTVTKIYINEQSGQFYLDYMMSFFWSPVNALSIYVMKSLTQYIREYIIYKNTNHKLTSLRHEYKTKYQYNIEPVLSQRSKFPSVLAPQIWTFIELLQS